MGWSSNLPTKLGSKFFPLTVVVINQLLSGMILGVYVSFIGSPIGIESKWSENDWVGVCEKIWNEPQQVI